ncbi:PQQ-binding-like beta-propeller repeat protein [Candidatus Latescibacterota bacterium]
MEWIKKLWILAEIILCTGFFAETLDAEGSPWPMFRHDLQHTGRTHYTGPSKPVLNWSFQTDDGIASSPSIGEDGTIYFGAGWGFVSSDDTHLYALNPDGSLKWRTGTLGGVFSSPAIGPDGIIYVGTLSPYFYAVEDAITHGVVQWRLNLGYKAYSSPSIGADGTIYCGNVDFHIYAMNPDGTLKWAYPTGWCIFSSPAIGSDGEIYIGSKDENLYALEDTPTSAKVRWKYSAGTFYDGHLIDSSPAIGHDGTIYFGTDQYGASGQTPVTTEMFLFAVNPDGTHKWSFPMEDGAESSPAIGSDGTIYIGSYDGNLYAVSDEGDQGVLNWAFQTQGSIDGSPTVDGCGTVYVGSRDSTVYAINNDGTLRWSFATGDGIESSPTIDDRGVLYIGCFDGNLYAIGNEGPDVGVISTLYPDIVYSDSLYTLSAKVQNFRADTEDFSIVCSVSHNGTPVYSDTVAVKDLAGGNSVLETFSPWLVSNQVGREYTITITTMLENDNNLYNDTIHGTITAGEVASDIVIDYMTYHNFSLSKPYPNPFNPSTSIRYNTPDGYTGNVAIKIFDLRGALVKTLVDRANANGTQTIEWDGTGENGKRVSSGVYIYQLQAGDTTLSHKMMLMR